MTEKIAVEFVRANAPYQPGDVATFAKARAEILVKAGAAKYPEVEPAEKSMPSAKTAVVTNYRKK